MEIITYEEFLKGKNYILIDVRTPKEFTEEKIPNSFNIPTLLDEERVIVGTTYVQKSKEEAKKLGVEFISRRLPEIFEMVQSLAKTYSKLVFMCAKGGMRSSSMTSFFESLGFNVAKLDGGYKGYREFIKTELPRMSQNFKYIVLHGRTGVGKTKILNKLATLGVQVLDLEKMANHKGSFFGCLGEKVPQNQKRLDGEIFNFLKNCEFEYILVESESKRIGNVYVPEKVYQGMVEGRHIFIDTSVENRIKVLMEDYSKADLKEIEKCILKLSRYVSNEKLKNYLDILGSGDLEKLAHLLILEYYDPLYEKSIKKHNFEFSTFYLNIDEGVKEIKKYIEKIEK